MRQAGEPGDCDVVWRPSRYVRVALLVLPCAACFAIWLCSWPWQGCLVVSIAVMMTGLRQWWRHRCLPPIRILLPINPLFPVQINQVKIDHWQLHWHHHLVVFCWHCHCGRQQRLVFWPDTLPKSQWRELRLTATARQHVGRNCMMTL